MDEAIYQKLQGKAKYPDDKDPRYTYTDTNGTIYTMIECSIRDVRNPPCEHTFRLYGDMNVEVDLLYSRQHLENWRLIEQMAEEKIRSWVVQPEKVLQLGSKP